MITNILHNALLASNKNNKFDWYTPLTFTAQKAKSTIKLTKIGSPDVNSLKYRTNINNIISDWSTYPIDTVITLTNVGDYVQFKNTKEQLSTSNNDYVQFVMTGIIAASGNIQSMHNYSHSCTDWCYSRMFYGCTSLTSAPELPATTLARNCYDYMFYGCTSLTSAPELPATTLVLACYANMFRDCTSLTVAPELPATNLTTSCYLVMFQHCTKLNYVKVGFTDWNELATSHWLDVVSSTGTFVCPTELPIQYGTSYIPYGWTVNP